MNFEKNKCAICNETFNPNDDIVVCPDCGTPYHRECFAKVLKCVNRDKHNINDNNTEIENNDTKNENTKDNRNNICKKCKTENPDECLFCEVCGNSLSVEQNQNSKDNQVNKNNNFQSINGFIGNNANPFDNPYGDFNPSDNIAGETVQDLTLFIGPNSIYFLNKFKNMDQNKTLTFNWAAAIFGPLYLAYRKSYIAAILFFIILKFSQISIYLVQLNVIKSTGTFNPNDLPDNILIFLSSFVIINLILRILCGLFFNKFYIKKAIKNINKQKKSKENGLKFSCEITKSGTVSLKLIFVFLIINILIGFVAQYLFMFYLN